MAKTHTESGALQIDRFKELARELGCDEDEAAFKAKLGQIARQKPRASQTRPPPSKKKDGA